MVTGCCVAQLYFLQSYSVKSFLINGTKNRCRIKEKLSYLKSSGHVAVSANHFFVVLRPSPFFLSLPSNAFPDIGSVGRIETKNLKKNNKKSRNSRPWYPRTMLKVNIHIFGLTKCTIYCEKCSCFCPCFSLCCDYSHFSD